MLPKPPLLRGGGPPAGGGGVLLDNRALRKKQQTRTTTPRCRKSCKPGSLPLRPSVRTGAPPLSRGGLNEGHPKTSPAKGRLRRPKSLKWAYFLVAFSVGVCYNNLANEIWAFSSAGRAPGSQSGGQGFDPPKVHQSKKSCHESGRIFALYSSVFSLHSSVFILHYPRTPDRILEMNTESFHKAWLPSQPNAFCAERPCCGEICAWRRGRLVLFLPGAYGKIRGNEKTLPVSGGVRARGDAGGS